jgi:hypothetical protein
MVFKTSIDNGTIANNSIKVKIAFHQTPVCLVGFFIMIIFVVALKKNILQRSVNKFVKTKFSQDYKSISKNNDPKNEGVTFSRKIIHYLLLKSLYKKRVLLQVGFTNLMASLFQRNGANS